MAWYLTQSGYTITMYFCLHQHYNQTFNCKTPLVIILFSNPLKIFFSSLLKALRGIGALVGLRVIVRGLNLLVASR